MKISFKSPDGKTCVDIDQVPFSVSNTDRLVDVLVNGVVVCRVDCFDLMIAARAFTDLFNG